MIAAWGVGLLGVNLAVTWAMVGLIWFVQIVHYPLFELVGGPGFGEYSAANQLKTSWVVGPVMAVETVTAVLLVVSPPPALGRVLPVLALVLLAGIHVCTATVQVPAHRALLERRDVTRVRSLVAGNWIRTVGWSGRGGLALVMLMVAIPA